MQSMPEQIGPYQLHAELGQGGMATVYRATDSLRGHPVALKVLPPEFTRNQMLVQRFLREGNSAVKLRHPNVIHVYEAGRADGYYYIAMELAPGGTLADRIRRQGIFSAQETAAILSQAARGLDYAHHLGYLHRDVKPSNIMFGEGDSRGQPRVMLTDFGIVKDLGGDQRLFTGTGQTVGTPAYMSPEQARGEEMDQRSDVYSLGVVAYNMLSGRVPFSATSSLALLRKIADDPVPPARQFNPRLAPGVDQVLERVLAKDPDRRYPTASAFVQALTQAAGESGRAAVPMAGQRATAWESSAETAAAPSQPGGRSRLGALLLGAGGMLAVLALVWVLASRGVVNVPGITPAQTQIVDSGGSGGPSAVTPTAVPTLPPATQTPAAAPALAQADTPTPIPATETSAPPTEEPTETPTALTVESAAEPTATATSTPTSTTTSAPPTETPTAPQDPSPTATQQAQAAGPTNTPTRLLIGGQNNTSTPTRTPQPTSTRAVTNTPTPAPTFTATPTRSAQAAPTQAAAPVAGGNEGFTVSNLRLPDFQGGTINNSTANFAWTSNKPLPANRTFELVFWPTTDGPSGYSGGRSPMDAEQFRYKIGPQQTTFQITIDLQGFEFAQSSWFRKNGEYYWGIFLAETPYRRIQFLGSPGSFKYVGGGNSGWDGGSPLPPCTGTLCD